MRRASEPIRRLCLGFLLAFVPAVARVAGDCIRPGTRPRGAATRPSQRSMLIRARARAAPVHAACPDLPMCSLPRASQAGISPQSRPAFRCPRFRRRTSRESRGKLRARQRPCKESCGIAATRGIVGALIALTNRATGMTRTSHDERRRRVPLDGSRARELICCWCRATASRD